MIDSDTVLDRAGFPLPESPRGQHTPSIAYGNLYVAYDRFIYAFDLACLNDGDPSTDPYVWDANIGPYLLSPDVKGFVGSSPSIANGVLFIEAGDMLNGTFFAINALNGNIDWCYHGVQGMGYSIATPAASDRYVAFCSAHDIANVSGLYIYTSQ